VIQSSRGEGLHKQNFANTYHHNLNLMCDETGRNTLGEVWKMAYDDIDLDQTVGQ
jgi:hypothetical protein